MVLMVDHKPKCVYVHRLIMAAHKPNEYDPNLTVDHVDCNPSNNHVSNLRMATMKEQHSNRRPKARTHGAPVFKIDREGTITLFRSTHEAARETGVSQSSIQRCAVGEYEMAGDCYWMYEHALEPAEDLPDEKWSVVGDVGKRHVHVSTKGRVRTLVGGSWIVKTCEELCKSNGYPKVQIAGKDHRVHRLVARLFLDPPVDAMANAVNHRDGNKLNSDITNLEWVTPRQNALHAHSAGLIRRKNGVVKLTEW